MIQNLTVAQQWANTVGHKQHWQVPRAWHTASRDRKIIACKHEIYYVCIQSINLHRLPSKHFRKHIRDSILFKNCSVMFPCSSGPLHCLVSGWPEAFKCFKPIITLMLCLPLWALCLFVGKWNAIEIEAKMGMFRHFGGCWGFAVCKGIKKGTENRQTPRMCYVVTGKVWERLG